MKSRSAVLVEWIDEVIRITCGFRHKVGAPAPGCERPDKSRLVGASAFGALLCACVADTSYVEIRRRKAPRRSGFPLVRPLTLPEGFEFFSSTMSGTLSAFRRSRL